MGICSSCLGLGRRASRSEPSDTDQLVGGDPYQPHYGTVASQLPHAGPQPDPEEIRRQRDALERICAQTSDKLIDVSQSANPDEGSKMANEYPRLFMERFPPNQQSGSRPSSSGTAIEEDETTWLADVTKAHGEEGDWDHVKVLYQGSLTIQFDEVLGLGRGASPARA